MHTLVVFGLYILSLILSFGGFYLSISGVFGIVTGFMMFFLSLAMVSVLFLVLVSRADEMRVYQSTLRKRFERKIRRIRRKINER